MRYARAAGAVQPWSLESLLPREDGKIADAPADSVEAGAPEVEIGSSVASDRLARGPIEELAEYLHFSLEKYDPTDDPVWEELTEHQKEIYRTTVRAMLSQRVLIEAALRDYYLQIGAVL
jgi:hypothetical protein